MPHIHPKRDEHGKCVAIAAPSQPSAWSNWYDADAIATAVPGGSLPAIFNGVSMSVWGAAPVSNADWQVLADRKGFGEPPFKAASGKAIASGAVVLERDGRVWIVSPTNDFGGYRFTFPKGKVEPESPLSLKANALKEVYEETGLQVELLGFLADVTRSTSTTRYYLARRLAGSPADMGWESQAVHLVPGTSLRALLKNPSDAHIVAALERVQKQS